METLSETSHRSNELNGVVDMKVLYICIQLASDWKYFENYHSCCLVYDRLLELSSAAFHGCDKPCIHSGPFLYTYIYVANVMS